jgi:hypothetical protein
VDLGGAIKIYEDTNLSQKVVQETEILSEKVKENETIEENRLNVVQIGNIVGESLIHGIQEDKSVSYQENHEVVERN